MSLEVWMLNNFWRLIWVILIIFWCFQLRTQVWCLTLVDNPLNEWYVEKKVVWIIIIEFFLLNKIFQMLWFLSHILIEWNFSQKKDIFLPPLIRCLLRALSSDNKIVIQVLYKKLVFDVFSVIIKIDVKKCFRVLHEVQGIG